MSSQGKRAVNHLLREEAVLRQGTTSLGRFAFAGDPNRACFESGSEGLVQLATDLQTGRQCRIKCFWLPNRERAARARLLVSQQLAFTGVAAGDALGGAPYELLGALGPHTPFALVMKNVRGRSWRALKELAIAGGVNPPNGWPSLQVRATWAYALATAVSQLEARGLVHADLSDGNVIVDASGDFALVDFDAFVLPKLHMRPLCRGSESYAAPEIWETGKRSVWGWRMRPSRIRMGSDRTGLALLVQEFLLMGQRGLSFTEAFGWGYRQVQDLGAFTASAHPLLCARYPELAKLVDSALGASDPSKRPSPEAWRCELAPIAEGKAHQHRLVLHAQHPTSNAAPLLPVAADVDLAHTPFGIRATLVASMEGTFAMEVHEGASIFAKGPGGSWEEHAAGSRIALCADMTFFDQQGKLPARVDEA